MQDSGSTSCHDSFGQRLRKLRSSRAISVSDISSSLHISISGYRSWELGRSFPSWDNLISLADFFDVTVDSLLGRSFGNSDLFEYARLRWARLLCNVSQQHDGSVILHLYFPVSVDKIGNCPISNNLAVNASRDIYFKSRDDFLAFDDFISLQAKFFSIAAALDFHHD